MSTLPLDVGWHNVLVIVINIIIIIFFFIFLLVESLKIYILILSSLLSYASYAKSLPKYICVWFWKIRLKTLLVKIELNTYSKKRHFKVDIEKKKIQYLENWQDDVNIKMS